MATRVPLVINAGQVQQLQSGDILSAGVATYDLETLLNGEASTAIIGGMAVYMSAAGTMKRAEANATATALAVGIGAAASTAASTSGNVAVGGVFSQATTLWDAVAGTSGGLVFNTTYYLSAVTAGSLTATAPSTIGQAVVIIGRAISTTDMQLVFSQPILL